MILTIEFLTNVLSVTKDPGHNTILVQSLQLMLKTDSRSTLRVYMYQMLITEGIQTSPSLFTGT